VRYKKGGSRHMPTPFQIVLHHRVHKKIDTFLPCFQIFLREGDVKGRFVMISKLVRKTTQLVIFESNEDTILKYFLFLQNVAIYLVTLRKQCTIQGMSQGMAQMGERNRIQETIEYTMMVVEMKVMHQMVFFMFYPQNFGNIQSK
jgi:hypothetical protein